MSCSRVPVTLLTGFLGAGKTTLLNAVLSDTSAGRVAVIVNEFGATGIDHDLIASVTDEVVLMKSGCLCCSARGDLADTVATLLARRSSGELAFERIVIETTGLADPAPVLQILLGEAALAQVTRMDGVVTVVDALNGDATLDLQFEAVSQAAVADLIVLSKTDLASKTAIQTLERRLRDLNAGARILRSEHGRGVHRHIWGLGGPRPSAAPTDVLAWAGGTAAAPDPFANLSGIASPAAGSRPPPHDARVGTASIVLEEPIKDEVFTLWLNTLLALRGPNILRLKGIVFFEGTEAPFVIHGVQRTFDPPVQLAEWRREDTTSRIVIISRDIEGWELRRSFETLRTGYFWRPTEPIPQDKAQP